MANSWWEQANEDKQRAADNARFTGQFVWGSERPTNLGFVSAPGDWDKFRQDFGQGNATEQDYRSWQNAPREKAAMADLLGQAGATPVRQANPFGVPVMETGNRFEAGLAGNERRLNALLDDPEAIRNTASYQFRVKQGQEALQRSLAAKGMLGSGNRLMELTKYGQDMASQEYEAQHNRLAGLVGMYGTNWIGDKNANTSRFNALANAWQGGEQAATQRFGSESDLWGKRAGTLADLYKTNLLVNKASGGVGGFGGTGTTRVSTNVDMRNFNPGGFV